MNNDNLKAAVQVAQNPEAFLSNMDLASIGGLGMGMLALAALAAVIVYFVNQ